MTTAPFIPKTVLRAEQLESLRTDLATLTGRVDDQETGSPLNRLALGIITNAPQAASLAAFGDSITAGYASSTPAKSWVGLLGAALGVTPLNGGISGSQAADQAGYVYPAFTPATTGSQLATFVIGTNDDWIYNGNVYRQASFRLFHAAILAWLATPNKLIGQADGISYAGIWTASPKYGGLTAKQTDALNATASVTLYGPTAYIAYTMENASAATFDVLVDGVVKGSYTVAPEAGVTITTNLGATFGSALIRLTNLGDSPHAIQVKKTSAAGTLTLDWVAQAAGQNYASGVQVIAGGFPRTIPPSLSAAVFQGLIKQNVQQLAGDGLPISYADVPGFIVPATDLIGDGVHPNDLGMGHVFDAIMSTLNSQSRAGVWHPPATRIIPDTIGENIVRGSNHQVMPEAFSSVIAGGDAHTINLSFNAIAGGRFNVCQGYFNFTAGFSNVMSGTYCVALGASAADRGQLGVHAYAAGAFINTGDAQVTTRPMRVSTTNAVATRITGDGVAPGAQNTIVLPNAATYSLKLSVLARQTGGAGGTVGDSASWTANLLVKRGANAAATSLVSMVRTTPGPALAFTTSGTPFAPDLSDAAAAAWRIAIAPDTTNGGVAITATGEINKTIQWVARVDAIETVG